MEKIKIKDNKVTISKDFLTNCLFGTGAIVDDKTIQLYFLLLQRLSSDRFDKINYNRLSELLDINESELKECILTLLNYDIICAKDSKGKYPNLYKLSIINNNFNCKITNFDRVVLFNKTVRLIKQNTTTSKILIGIIRIYNKKISNNSFKLDDMNIKNSDIDLIKRCCVHIQYLDAFSFIQRIKSLIEQYKSIEQVDIRFKKTNSENNYIPDIENIKIYCGECKDSLVIKKYISNNEILEKVKDMRKYSSEGFCCIKDAKLKIPNIEKNKNIQEYIDKVHGKGNFTIINTNQLKCKDNHIIYKQLNYGEKLKDLKCWICDDKIQQLAFFNILQELGGNYKIKQEYSFKSSLPGSNRKISSLIIYTYNDIGYLTGKISFYDPIGEQQAKANSNNIVFKLFDINYIDNKEYCLMFFRLFFEQISNKFKDK